jgi:hypothetical protein
LQANQNRTNTQEIPDMTTELIKPNGGALVVPGQDPFGAFADATASSSWPYARFTKYAQYEVGKDGTVIPVDTVVVAVMDQMRTGYKKWLDGTIAGTVMGAVADRFIPPPRRELGDNDPAMWPQGPDGEPRDPWQLCSELPLNLKDTRDVYLFTTSSRGGISAIGALCRVHSLRRDNDTWPVIKLQVGSYKHKQYGVIKHPMFTVVGWAKKFAVGGDVPATDTTTRGDMDDSIPF